MKCPFCSHLESKVVDSRPCDDGNAIRRRRECESCEKRWTSYEKVESIPIMVIKKDNSRQPFDRRKLLNGLLRACEKRPVSIDKLEKLIDGIESSICNSMDREVLSTKIGEMVLDELRAVDEVAYIRFASVYKKFEDVQSFVNELKTFK